MRKLSRKYRIVLSISAVLLAIAMVVLFIIAGHYDSRIKKELPPHFAKATDSLYHISVKGVSVNLLTRTVVLRKVHVWVDTPKMRQQMRDSCAKKHYYNINIPRLKISAIMWDKLIGGEGLSCSVIKVLNAQVEVYKTQKELCIYDTVAKPRKQRKFSTSIVKIINADVSYINNTNGKSHKYYFNDTHITLTGWKSTYDTTRFLMSDEGKISVGKFRYENPDLDYDLNAERITFSSDDSRLAARNITLKLKMSEKDFYRKYNMQKEFYDLSFPTFEVTELDWFRLFHHKELHAGIMYLNNSDIKVVFNRLMGNSTKNKLGNYPNQLLYKLKLPVYLEQVKLNSGTITYTEVSDITGQKASIYFDNVNGNIENITNIPKLVVKDKYSRAKLTGKLNKYSDIQTTIHFLLNDPKGHFTVDLNIDGLQGLQINDQAKAFTYIEVKSLNMKNLSMKITGDEYNSGGHFKMLYNNLSIKIMKADSDAKKEKRKKGFMTFIANNLILYSSNPMPGGQVRTVNTHIQRDVTKSFFNQIWRNVHQGVQETTVRDMNIIRWMRSEDAKNKKQGGSRLKDIFKSDKKRDRRRKRSSAS